MSDRGLRLLLAALSIAGLMISAYLTWTHVQGVVPACVGDSSGCATVQASRYSAILGVLVAALGLAGYAGLLLSALLKGEIGVFFSAYLTWPELFVIRAICQWCLASAALMAGSLLLVALRGRRIHPSSSW